MRTPAVLTAAIAIVTFWAPPAGGAPATVDVRVEGRTETLFEGPIVTDGHNVRAASDTKAPKAGRRCNGLNNGQNPTPGPTPTAAAVDAMSILDLDFDGRWYAEPFEDYFIERWGPDAEDEGKGEYWGIAVNNVFTGVGGCQYLLDQGDEVLWAYDAFTGRPRLSLYPADYSAGAVTRTASVQLGQSFEVEVDSWDAAGEGTPPPSPERSGSEPFEGAEVAPVVAGPNGFEAIETGDPAAVVTGAEGRAEIEFEEVGWHRIKATATGSGGKEIAVRSNRLDVCVFELAASECPPLPADDMVRTPPPVESEGEEPAGPGGSNPTAGGSGDSRTSPPPDPKSSAAKAGQVRLRVSRLDRSRVSRGLVKVSWRVLDAGAGIAKWTISSQRLDRQGARYVTRARGGSASSATLRLPRGAGHRLRLTVTDVLGRGSAIPLGQVQVPR